MTWVNPNNSIKISTAQDDFVKSLIRDRFAEKNVHILELAIALGLRRNVREKLVPPTQDSAKVGQFDPEGVLEVVIMARYGNLSETERLKTVQEHAAAGLTILSELVQESNGLLDVESLLSEL
jgi:hypothetical protein